MNKANIIDYRTEDGAVIFQCKMVNHPQVFEIRIGVSMFENVVKEHAELQSSTVMMPDGTIEKITVPE